MTTKAKAHEKRAAVAFPIGYPKKRPGYMFEIGARTFGVNALGTALARAVARLRHGDRDAGLRARHDERRRAARDRPPRSASRASPT